MAEKIKDGSHVIVCDNSKQKRVYQVKKDQVIEHYKCIIECNELIGKSYNTFYLVTDPSKKDGKLTEITDQRSLVKEHLVESAGNFEAVDDYGAEDEEEEVPQGGNKVQRTEGMAHVHEQKE